MHNISEDNRFSNLDLRNRDRSDNYYRVSFIVSPIAAALSDRKPASAGTSRDSGGAQGYV